MEFELPREEDAHLDAVIGARWRELVGDLYTWLITFELIEENDDCRRAYRNVQQQLRSEMGTAGLTLCLSERLREFRAEHEKSCSDKMDAHLREQELRDMAQPSPDQNIIPRKSRKAKGEAPPKKPGAGGKLHLPS